jgi:predicted acyltransferase
MILVNDAGDWAINDVVFGSWLSPVNESLAFAIATVLLWYLVARELDRRGVYVKV